MTWAFLVNSVPFTPDVIEGQTSLGGSESACLGTARALQARGHDVHIFASQLDVACAGAADSSGVVWHPFDEFPTMNQFIEWDVVVSLRMVMAWADRRIHARMRVLWNQDLLVPGDMQKGVMSCAWAWDHFAYVSPYHQAQWEQMQPELAGHGWVTRNGYDPADLPTAPVTKDPHRILYTSRPERGLGPLLEMWPALRQEHPDAELRICRYSSMYDTGPGSWSDVCAEWDRKTAAVNEAVGGITLLGGLTKPALYQELSAAAVLWYPGIENFAETGCIAAVEAQACGTPVVASYRGALPSFVVNGTLVKGDPTSATYQTQSVAAVSAALVGCGRMSRAYRDGQAEGREAMASYTYATIAQAWETQVGQWFAERYAGNRRGVLRQLLHEDDHVAAMVVATELAEAGDIEGHDAVEYCRFIMDGKDHSAEDYGDHALADPGLEADASVRFQAVVPWFEGCEHVLDVAGGNGSFALSLCRAYPDVRVTSLDFSAANVARATVAAEKEGFGDRCTFQQVTVYDFDAHQMHAEWEAWAHPTPAAFDGLFVGEFIEHVVNTQAVVDGLEAVVSDEAQVVYTCPHGACVELVPPNIPLHRGHVHRFHMDDLTAVWGSKAGFAVQYIDSGLTGRGLPLGNWAIRYRVDRTKATGVRPLQTRIQRTRPLAMLSVGIIAQDAESDIDRCLKSVWGIADEIVIGDTGSTDTTKDIAARYGRLTRVIDLPPIAATETGFSGARNAVLRACKGDWFLWIDTDEQLMNFERVRRYLDSDVFAGYVLRQTHLYVDGPPTFDIPVRLFRHTGQVQFYGCIHEQPQDGDPNADIFPTLEVVDTFLVHTGYLTQRVREEKRVNRNLPLLMRDQQVFKDRLLGQVLLLREAVIQSDQERLAAGHMTPRAQTGYAHALRIFTAHFDDPAHKYHKLARPWYEAALQHMGAGWEQEIAIAGKFGGMGASHAKPERVWVRDGNELQRLIAHQTKQMAEAMATKTYVTDPDDLFADGPDPVEELSTVTDTGELVITDSVGFA